MLVLFRKIICVWTASMTVWSFGSSHSTGHEIKSGFTQDDLRKFYNRFGFEDYYEYFNCKSAKTVKKLLKKWDGFDTSNPNLSFPGIVAKLKNTELKTFAKNGTGIDYSYKMFLKNKHKFKNDDIILFELSPVFRYESTNGDHARLADIKSPQQYNRYPSPFIMNKFYKFVVDEIKEVAYTIDIYCETSDQMPLDVYKSNNISLHLMCETHKIGQYPGGHYHYDAHKLFAEYLVKEVIK